MIWKVIEGYRYPYRINDQGEVQKLQGNGEWKTLKPYLYTGTARVQLLRQDGTKERPSISSLVADHFMGGTPPGMCRVHRNGMKTDNAVENIIFLPRKKACCYARPGNSRSILKVDKRGRVVAVYRSEVEAAKANYISQQAVSRRCHGLLRNPYRLDGHNYIFEDKKGRTKNA